MQVFLIPQKQLEDEIQKGRVQAVSIQRVGTKQWFPLFEVGDTPENVVTCSLRIQSKEEVRYWADLRLLVDWLRDKCGVESCVLLLSDLHFNPGETRNDPRR